MHIKKINKKSVVEMRHEEFSFLAHIKGGGKKNFGPYTGKKFFLSDNPGDDKNTRGLIPKEKPGYEDNCKPGAGGRG